MKFYDIDEDSQIVPGEFLLHVPSKAIVLCGAYDGKKVRALDGGKLFEDEVINFKKLIITHRERRTKYVAGCKSCGS